MRGRVDVFSIYISGQEEWASTNTISELVAARFKDEAENLHISAEDFRLGTISFKRCLDLDITRYTWQRDSHGKT